MRASSRVSASSATRASDFAARALTSNTYYDWQIDRTYILYGVQAGVAQFFESFKEFPPSQKAASFNFDAAVDKMKQNAGSH